MLVPVISIQGSSGSPKPLAATMLGAGRSDVGLQPAVAGRALARGDVGAALQFIEVGDGDDALAAGEGS